MDIEINTSRGHSTTFSANNSRVFSSYSGIFSMDYIDEVKELTNNSSWADQVKIENLQESFLSYVLLEERMKNTMSIMPINKISQMLYINNHNNACSSQVIKTMVISYIVNQPIDLLL